MTRRLLCGLVLLVAVLGAVGPAAAACTVETFTIGDRIHTCITCCTYTGCTTTCG